MSNAALLKGKHVAIVGAGPAGLTLARLLQLQGVSVHVYERDQSATARDQGGTLDLHEDSGQLALARAGLLEGLRQVYHPEGQLTKVFDKHGQLAVELRAEDEAETRPEIDRHALRDLLLGSLAPDTVSWAHAPLRIEADGHRLRLVFAHDTVHADLVVGCDGAWSKVRPLVSELRPHYGGVTFIETRISSPDARCRALIGPGSVLSLGDNKGLLAQRNGDGHIRVYVALRVPADWSEQCGIDFARPAQARAALLALFTDWAPELTALLEASDDLFLPRPLFTFPPDQTWQTRANVTLVGDAAHVMPPFTGRGANYAMLDAVELAAQLTSDAHVDLAGALGAYESGMHARMSAAIAETLAAQDVVIAADAPAGLVGEVESRKAPRDGQ